MRPIRKAIETLVPRRRVALMLVAVAACVVAGCGLDRPMQKVDESFIKQVQRDPFPSAQQVGLE